MAGWDVTRVFLSGSMTGKCKIVMAGLATVLAWGVFKLVSGRTALPEYILNFNGSRVNQLRKAGAGCVIRDKEGNLIVAAASNLDDCCHVVLADAVALRIGLELAKVFNIKLGLIQGDSFETIQRVRIPEIISLEPTVPMLSDLIEEIRCAFNEQSINPETQLRLTIREKNEVAHELALLGRQLHQERIYVRGQNLPHEVATLIQREKLIWDLWLRVAWQG